MRSIELAVSTFALAGLLFGALAMPARADENYCSDSEARAADQVVYTIGNWAQFRDFFEKYGGCDDGDVYEELSDRASDLLANQWDTLAKLNGQAANNPRYAKFVLSHINPTIMSERYPKIIDNATNHCPADAADLCRQIAAAASAPPAP